MIGVNARALPAAGMACKDMNLTPAAAAPPHGHGFSIAGSLLIQISKILDLHQIGTVLAVHQLP
jgi:hypothetical protein